MLIDPLAVRFLKNVRQFVSNENGRAPETGHVMRKDMSFLEKIGKFFKIDPKFQHAEMSKFAKAARRLTGRRVQFESTDSSMATCHPDVTHTGCAEPVRTRGSPGSWQQNRFKEFHNSF
jgi:hypothetical protein